jgi:hypothetical protein
MVNRWVIAALPMPGSFALPSDAPSSSVLPWPDAAISADDRVSDGLVGVRLFPCSLLAPGHGPGATERHTGTAWPEVERSADSTLIDRESGTVGLISKPPRNPG